MEDKTKELNKIKNLDDDNLRWVINSWSDNAQLPYKKDDLAPILIERMQDKLNNAQNFDDMKHALKFLHEVKSFNPNIKIEFTLANAKKFEELFSAEYAEYKENSTKVKNLKHPLKELRALDISPAVNSVVDKCHMFLREQRVVKRKVKKAAHAAAKFFHIDNIKWTIPEFKLPLFQTGKSSEISRLIDICDYHKKDLKYLNIDRLLRATREFRYNSDPHYFSKSRRAVRADKVIENINKALEEAINVGVDSEVIAYCQKSIQERLGKLKSDDPIKIADERLKKNDYQVLPTIEKSPEIQPINAVKTLSEQQNKSKVNIEIIRELGAGSFGKVYLCRVNNVLKAVKVDSVQTDQSREEFKIEGQNLLDVSKNPSVNCLQGYPAVIEESNFSELKGKECLVTDFIEFQPGSGKSYSLEDFFEKNKDIIKEKSWDKNFDILLGGFFVKLKNEIDRLHNLGKLHRDIAPRNIMMRGVFDPPNSDNLIGLEPVIVDMGRARTFDKETGFFKDNSITGPLKWMDMMSLSKQEYTSRSDTHALKVTMINTIALANAKDQLAYLTLDEGKIFNPVVLCTKQCRELGDQGLLKNYYNNAKVKTDGPVEILLTSFEEYITTAPVLNDKANLQLEVEKKADRAAMDRSADKLFLNALKTRLEKGPLDPIAIKMLSKIPVTDKLKKSFLLMPGLSIHDVKAYEMFQNVDDDVVRHAFVEKYSKLMAMGSVVSVTAEQVILINKLVDPDNESRISEKCRELQNADLMLPDHFSTVLKAISLSETLDFEKNWKGFEEGMKKLLPHIQSSNSAEVERGIEFKSKLDDFEKSLNRSIKIFENAIKLMNSAGKDTALQEQSLEKMKELQPKVQAAHKQFEAKLDPVLARASRQIEANQMRMQATTASLKAVQPQWQTTKTHTTSTVDPQNQPLRVARK